eukprot:1394246-Pleurochrysis_carterae.AAC.1
MEEFKGKVANDTFFALVALLFDIELKGIDVVKAFTQATLSDADLSVSRWKAFKSTTRRHVKGLFAS